jgi:hypothetical protein
MRGDAGRAGTFCVSRLSESSLFGGTDDNDAGKIRSALRLYFWGFSGS